MRRTPILAILSLAAAAGPASACSVVAPTPGAAARGDVVVAGVVRSVTGRVGQMRPLRVRLRVDTVLRGEAPATLTVYTAASSASCGWNFQRGHRYLVFASRVTATGDSIPKGRLGTSLGDANRELTRRETVTQDDLYWPAPEGFDPNADMTPRQFVAFRGHPLFWTGAFGVGGQLRTIRVHEPTRGVTVVYADGRHRMHITTRPACPRTRPVPGGGVGFTDRLIHVRGVPAGERDGGLTLFTGTVEVRITGGSAAGRLATARRMTANSRPVPWGTIGPLVAPEVPASRLASCVVVERVPPTRLTHR